MTTHHAMKLKSLANVPAAQLQVRQTHTTTPACSAWRERLDREEKDFLKKRVYVSKKAGTMAQPNRALPNLPITTLEPPFDHYGDTTPANTERNTFSERSGRQRMHPMELSSRASSSTLRSRTTNTSRTNTSQAPSEGMPPMARKNSVVRMRSVSSLASSRSGYSHGNENQENFPEDSSRSGLGRPLSTRSRTPSERSYGTRSVSGRSTSTRSVRSMTSGYLSQSSTHLSFGALDKLNKLEQSLNEEVARREYAERELDTLWKLVDQMGIANSRRN